MIAPSTRTRRRVSGVAAATLGALLLVSAAGCTGSQGPDESSDTGASAAPSSPAPEQSETPEVAPAPPARVRVTRVSGRLKEKERETLADNVEKVVLAYFDDAFVGGEYPRESFGDAFETFSAGAARQADDDRDLLTNRDLGPTTQAVEVKQRTAYLSVLAPYKVAAGVTARVHLQFRVDRGDKPSKLVNVKGRLMLTRKPSGGWEIFGYDLSKNARTVEGGA